MKTVTNVGKISCTGVACIGGALSWFFGSLDGLLITLLVVMAADFVTGWLVALYQKKISSKICSKGLAKKAGIIILCGLLHVADVYMLNQGNALRDAFICAMLLSEATSLLENAGALGIPIPQKIREVLAQLKDKNQDANH